LGARQQGQRPRFADRLPPFVGGGRVGSVAQPLFVIASNQDNCDFLGWDRVRAPLAAAFVTVFVLRNKMRRLR
jgi:hypothetical protein